MANLDGGICLRAELRVQPFVSSTDGRILRCHANQLPLRDRRALALESDSCKQRYSIYPDPDFRPLFFLKRRKRDTVLLIQTTNRKSYACYRLATLLMTSSDPQIDYSDISIFTLHGITNTRSPHNVSMTLSAYL